MNWVFATYIVVGVAAWIVATALHEPDAVWGDNATDRMMDRCFHGFMFMFGAAMWPAMIAVAVTRYWLRITDVGGLWSRTHVKKENEHEREWWKV